MGPSSAKRRAELLHAEIERELALLPRKPISDLSPSERERFGTIVAKRFEWMHLVLKHSFEHSTGVLTLWRFARALLEGHSPDGIASTTYTHILKRSNIVSEREFSNLLKKAVRQRFVERVRGGRPVGEEVDESRKGRTKTTYYRLTNRGVEWCDAVLTAAEIED